jgi:hypothetical protein
MPKEGSSIKNTELALNDLINRFDNSIDDLMNHFKNLTNILSCDHALLKNSINALVWNFIYTVCNDKELLKNLINILPSDKLLQDLINTLLQNLLNILCSENALLKRLIVKLCSDHVLLTHLINRLPSDPELLQRLINVFPSDDALLQNLINVFSSDHKLLKHLINLFSSDHALLQNLINILLDNLINILLKNLINILSSDNAPLNNLIVQLSSGKELFKNLISILPSDHELARMFREIERNLTEEVHIVRFIIKLNFLLIQNKDIPNSAALFAINNTLCSKENIGILYWDYLTALFKLDGKEISDQYRYFIKEIALLDSEIIYRLRPEFKDFSDILVSNNAHKSVEQICREFGYGGNFRRRLPIFIQTLNACKSLLIWFAKSLDIDFHSLTTLLRHSLDSASKVILRLNSHQKQLEELVKEGMTFHNLSNLLAINTSSIDGTCKSFFKNFEQFKVLKKALKNDFKTGFFGLTVRELFGILAKSSTDLGGNIRGLVKFVPIFKQLGMNAVHIKTAFAYPEKACPEEGSSGRGGEDKLTHSRKGRGGRWLKARLMYFQKNQEKIIKLYHCGKMDADAIAEAIFKKRDLSTFENDQSLDLSIPNKRSNTFEYPDLKYQKTNNPVLPPVWGCNERSSANRSNTTFWKKRTNPVHRSYDGSHEPKLSQPRNF